MNCREPNGYAIEFGNECSDVRISRKYSQSLLDRRRGRWITKLDETRREDSEVAGRGRPDQE